MRTTDLQVQSHLEPLKVKLSYTILFVSIWCGTLIVTMIVYEVMIHNFHIFAFLTDIWHLRATEDLQVQSHLEPQKVKIRYTMLFVSIWCGTLIVTMIVYEFVIHNFHIFVFLTGLWHFLRTTYIQIQSH